MISPRLTEAIFAARRGKGRSPGSFNAAPHRDRHDRQRKWLAPRWTPFTQQNGAVGLLGEDYRACHFLTIAETWRRNSAGLTLGAVAAPPPQQQYKARGSVSLVESAPTLYYSTDREGVAKKNEQCTSSRGAQGGAQKKTLSEHKIELPAPTATGDVGSDHDHHQAHIPIQINSKKNRTDLLTSAARGRRAT